MYYGELKKCDIANGIGVRVTLFVSGCRNHCPGCFQPQTWDFHYGKPFTQATADEIFAELDQSYVGGLTVLGGEPLEPENQRDLLPLLRQVRARYPQKTVWCFTGYRLDDELQRDGSHPRCEVTDAMLDCIDVLVDGPFLEERHDVSLRFRGSSNQRLIDMAASRAALREVAEAAADSPAAPDGKAVVPVVIWHDDEVYETHTM